MSEVEIGPAESGPAGLDAILDKSLAALDAPETPEPDKSEQSDEPKTDATGRLHAKDGKFAKKSQEAEAPKGTAEVKTTEVTAPVEPAQVQPVEPPARMTAEEKAAFAKWTPDVQKIVAERYKATEADYTRKTQEAAEIRKSAEPLLNALKPFDDYLKQLGPVTGRTPPELIGGLLHVEHQLRTGTPEQKYQTFANIARDYGIDLRAFATGQIPQEDPRISQMRQQISELSQWRSQYEQQTEAQQKAQLDSTIDAFAKATDQAGQPKYPHFERVRGVMAQHLAGGDVTTLEEAYTKAMEPINAAIAQELQARTKAAEQQRAEAVAKAQKAAPVKSSGNQPGGQTKAKGLDAILDSALAGAGVE